ncbi:MAG: hypothetical protein AAF824_12300 [Bacteroidota bacterium]
MENVITGILVVALLAAGIYFAYWGIQKTLADTSGRNRAARRKSKKR